MNRETVVVPESPDLVHTGPGTLAGRYLRSFWQPVFRVEDLPAARVVPLRIMGEDLTLYRVESGESYGLLNGRCGHRQTRLHTGWVEGDCLRCTFHGWKYDATGQCVEQPAEQSSFADKVRIKSYLVREYLDLIWAYMGQGEPPPMRRFPDFEKPGVLALDPPQDWPCNFVNGVSGDPGHVAFTHRESFSRMGYAGSYQREIFKVRAEETEYGARFGQERPGQPIHYNHLHMPNAVQVPSAPSAEAVGGVWTNMLLIRVPVDDEHQVTFQLNLARATGEAAAEYLRQREQTWSASPNEYAEAILAGRMRIQDVPKDVSISCMFVIEDYITQVGQGTIAQSANDRLGPSDVGIVTTRRIWERELRALATGRPTTQWTEPDVIADIPEMEGAARGR